MKTFGEKLKEARQTAKMDQEDLAARVGVTQRTIQKYEAGKGLPRVKTLSKLAESLGVTVAYLRSDDIIDDYTIQIDQRLEDVRREFGSRNALKMEDLLRDGTAFFAGGDYDIQEKSIVLNAMVDAFTACCAKASEKFTPYAYRSSAADISTK